MSVGDAVRRVSASLRGPFVRGVAAVAGGTAVAQVITVLVAPITSRQYGPDAYGVANIFIATLGILGSLGGLSYWLAIALPKRDEDAAALVGLSVRIAVVVAALLALIFVAAGEALAGAIGLGGDVWMLVLVAPAVLLVGVSGALSQWLVRGRRFKVLGALDATQSATQNGARVAVGFVAPSAGALVAVTAAGTAFFAALAYAATRRSLRAARAAAGDGSRERRRRVAREFRDYPLFREPQVLLNAVSGNLPVILLATLFDPVVAGLYGLGHNVLGLPSSLIAASLGKVYLPHAAEIARERGDVRRLLLRATGALAAIGVVPFALVIIFGPWLFGLVFGQEWAVAGEYARWLALWSFAGFVNVPSVQTIALLGLQHRFLVFEVALCVARVAAIVAAAAASTDALVAVAAFSLVGLAANAVLIAAVIRASGTRRRESF